MAWGNYGLDKGFRVTAAITKYRIVKFNGTQTVTAVTAATDEMVGVAQFGVTSAEILRGKDASVRVEGVSEVEASGAIAVGQWCQLEADGRVKVLAGSSGAKIVGKCVGTPSTNAGDRISMLLVHTYLVA